MSTIRILVTGGTFDKEYNELRGELYFRDTHIHEILELGRTSLDCRVKTLMMIDSMEMTDNDRKYILDSCKHAKENYIIVTHGTDTMEITAQVFGAANLDKTIILTGAMIPYKFGSSDGLFNMGCALAYVQVLPKGVYVAMQGHYFLWNNVTKNRAGGFFEKKIKD
ncbi:MAG TPA: asparaginase domain-containing protein [Chitinophagales bacterium]|nr:asparaginase domain-containing protein [Chitinophagales bacterium]